MKALICEQTGELADLRVAEVTDPIPGAQQALVRIHYCALNFPDVLMVQGKYQRKPPLPFSPGCEFAGTVEELGPTPGSSREPSSDAPDLSLDAQAEPLRVGERVCGMVGFGCLAERRVFAVSDLNRIPESVDMAQAASLLYTYSTVLYALRNRGALAAGENLLVLGAGGGIGIAAVEMGKVLGARVVAAASSEDKLSLARAKGADATVCYPLTVEGRSAQFALAEQFKAEAGDGGFNVICDPVGGVYSEPALRAVAWGGRHLVIGFAAGTIPNIPLNLPLLKGCQIVGVLLGGATTHHPTLRASLSRELLEMLRAGQIAPHIGAEYDLANAGEALQALADRRAVGKVLVRC